MAGMLFGYPFNEELYSYHYKEAPDPITTALLDSGAMVEDGEIASMVANGSDTYTVPFYDVLGGTPANYDGQTDIPIEETSGGFLQGVVWGRTQGWKARDFIYDFNRANPYALITAKHKGFWAKQRQDKMLLIATKGLFGIAKPTNDEDDPNGYIADWVDNHTLDITSTSTSVGASNKLDAGTVGDAGVKACGDRAAGAFGLTVMHSHVARNLAKLDKLEFRKYTDPAGIQSTVQLADIDGGGLVIVWDGVPHTAATSTTAATYTTLAFGNGFFRYAPANVDKPVEPTRNVITNGGEDVLVTRIRETILPNGFSYTKVAGDTPSPTDAQLGTPSRWTPVVDPKCIAATRIVSNG